MLLTDRKPKASASGDGDDVASFAEAAAAAVCDQSSIMLVSL